MRVLVGVKRVVDFAVKVRVAADKTGESGLARLGRSGGVVEGRGSDSLERRQSPAAAAAAARTLKATLPGRGWRKRRWRRARAETAPRRALGLTLSEAWSSRA